MTLTRLVLAWLPVAAWFVLATYGTAVLIAEMSGQPGDGAVWARFLLALLKWRIIEAALLTLLASLWFDSLGSGGWCLLFLLLGALVTIPTWLQPGPEIRPRRVTLSGAGADIARYLVAGAILAWRLG
ncbi:MAG TPA: hypothetical protein VH137_04865 [Gemmatimonadales bacterium]|nr:hypothetical protein [Gemmatimonadales bacterium]